MEVCTLQLAQHLDRLLPSLVILDMHLLVMKQDTVPVWVLGMVPSLSARLLVGIANMHNHVNVPLQSQRDIVLAAFLHSVRLESYLSTFWSDLINFWYK